MHKTVLAVHREPKLLASLEMIFSNWGYPLEKATSIQEMNTRLKKVKPKILLLESGLLSSSQLDTLPLLARETKSGNVTIALLGENQGVKNLTADYSLPLPLDVFALYEAVQHSLEAIPRQDVRVKVRLPGMVRPSNKHFNLGEVLCLSAGGMFIRCGVPLPTGTQLEIVLPLLGLKRELEILGETIYQVTPCAENNYNQGVGICFSNLSSEEKQLLERYLEKQLQENLIEHLGQEISSETPLLVWKTLEEVEAQST